MLRIPLSKLTWPDFETTVFATPGDYSIILHAVLALEHCPVQRLAGSVDNLEIPVDMLQSTRTYKTVEDRLSYFYRRNAVW